jgi:uncharacterized RDD family membrane protein YckC
MSSSQEDSFNGQELSGWWARVGAQIIDSLIIGLVATISAFLLLLIFLAIFSGTNSGVVFIATLLFILFSLGVFIAIMVIYYGLTMKREGSKNGQSLGKEMFSITVIREGGEVVDFKYALFRQVAVIYLFFNVFVSIFTAGIGPFLNYLWPIWDEKRQALHDKIVGSRVIKL